MTWPDRGFDEFCACEDIDVRYTRWWLPIAPTETHFIQALKLTNESKYYEANLALKAIEDSVTIDSIKFSELPASKTNPS